MHCPPPSAQIMSPDALSPSFRPSLSTLHPRFSPPSFRSHGINQPWLPKKKTKASSRIICLCLQHNRKPAVKKGVDPEVRELVLVIVRNCSAEKPLMSTLNKYVRVIRTQHCFLLFEELGRRDNWLQCLEVFRWMQKQRWYVADIGIFSKLISVMGRKGKTRMASWLFTEMRNSGCRPDTSVYNALITAHLHTQDRSKGLAKALTYFNKMRGMDRCQPNVVTYNILLRAFAQAKDVKQVNALFKDLDESIVAPDAFTYNGVMDGYGKNGMIREMESVLSRMKSAGCHPDTITFNLLIDSYGRRQQFEKMEQVFKSLLRSKVSPALATFNSMITNFGKAQLREQAEQVFRKMVHLGFAPSYITNECLIIMYAHCDCVSRAREIYDGMLASSRRGARVRPSTLNAILYAYCLNGLPLEADLLLDREWEAGVVPGSSTYRLLYKAYTKAGMKNLVQKLLRRMEGAGLVPDKKFFLDALGAFGSSSPSQSNSESMNTAGGLSMQREGPSDGTSGSSRGSLLTRVAVRL